jgi:hypothetical protein
MSVGTDATGARVEGPTYLVSQTWIGNMTFAPHRAAIVDLPRDGGRMDMILGYPALRQAVWVFDFPARRWALQPNTRAQLGWPPT